MESYLPLIIPAKTPYNIYYRTHPNKSPKALFICRLDKPLKKPRLKKWFIHCGKIKSVELGEMEKSGKKISYAILEFKHSQSIRRSLDVDWLQDQIDSSVQQIKKPVDEDVEAHITKMEEDGFTMILPKKSKNNKYDCVPPATEDFPKKRSAEDDKCDYREIKRKKSSKKKKNKED